MNKPTILYATSLDGEITTHPVKPEHVLIAVTDDLWMYKQKDGSTHELWTTRSAALQSARRDVKRFLNYLSGLHKKLNDKIRIEDYSHGETTDEKLQE